MHFIRRASYYYIACCFFTTIYSLHHRWARSSFLEGGQKIFLLEGGHKKLKQQGVRGAHAKNFMAVLALFGQKLVPAAAGEKINSGQFF